MEIEFDRSLSMWCWIWKDEKMGNCLGMGNGVDKDAAFQRALEQLPPEDWQDALKEYQKTKEGKDAN